MPGDQDIADLLSALDEASTAAPGGLYAAALPAGGAASSIISSSAADADAAVAGLDAPGAGAAVAAGEQPAAGGKVAAVCTAVRLALEQRDKVHWSVGGSLLCLPAHELTCTACAGIIGTLACLCLPAHLLTCLSPRVPLPACHFLVLPLPAGPLPACHPDQPGQVRAAGGSAEPGAGGQGGGAAGGSGTGLQIAGLQMKVGGLGSYLAVYPGGFLPSAPLLLTLLPHLPPAYRAVGLRVCPLLRMGCAT